ncbi:MAG: FAD-dependent oxidoreductase, partial [Planctomycetia bacterium]
MSSLHPQHVVVIGGGLAGLAAAEALTRATDGGPPSRQVTLIEPSGRFGGVIATDRREGWLIERSADSFLAARPEAVDLVERSGLTGELIGVDPRVRRALVYHRGRTRPVPAGFRLLAPGQLRGILTTPLLTPGGRLRLVAERFVPARDRLVSDESLEHFAIRRLGRQAFGVGDVFWRRDDRDPAEIVLEQMASSSTHPSPNHSLSHASPPSKSHLQPSPPFRLG